MSGRTTSVVAWIVGGLAIAITLTSIVVVLATGAPASALSFPDPGIALAFPLVGALIASRRPGNSVGWVMLAIGAGGALEVASGAYAYTAQITYPGLPGEDWAAWLQAWVWAIGFALVANVLLVMFPDGEVPSRRWRAVVAVSLGNLALMAVSAALVPTAQLGASSRPIPSPFPVTLPAGVGEAISGVGFVIGLVLMVVCVVALVGRFRQSSGVLRLQLTWFTYGYLVGVLALVASVVVGLPWSGGASSPVLDAVSSIVPAVALGSIAVGVGVAVFRYRLYDIGRLVNRTIVYALLTAVLVGLYAALVVGIGTAIGRTSSPVLIAGATLVVAAAAGPLRRRIQEVIDRRFYRARYDSERTLAEFGARIRDEGDVDELRVLLQRAAGQTVQPSRVVVWIRGVDS
jgi:hypothetical protein